jgi:hypothetical protein
MRKRMGFTLALVALIVAAVAVPIGSAAPTKKSHKIDGSIVARGLEGNTVTGTVKGKLGSGAVIYVVSAGPNGTQNLDIKTFFPKGSIKAKANVTLVLQPDNTATFTGSGQINGGTALYKGAKGSFTTAGTIDANGIIRGTITGSAKY